MITLTKKEQKMRRLLIEVAAGVRSIIVSTDGGRGITSLTDYEEFSRRFKLGRKELFDSLEHISEYDTYENNGAPLLEMQLSDDTGMGLVGAPCFRDNVIRLLDEYEHNWPDKEKCHSVYWRMVGGKENCPSRLESYALEQTFIQNIEREKKRAEWYWRVNKTIPQRLEQSLKKEHIVADAETLQQWTEEDIAGIAMRTIPRGRYINLGIRYILLGDKPRFGYARYGDFFFANGLLYVIVKQSEDMEQFRNADMEQYLIRQAQKAPLATDAEYNVDAGSIAKKNMEKSVVINAVFAGVQTNIHDTRTNEPLFTGDVVAVKWSKRRAITQTLNAMTFADPPHYALPLDNHALDLMPEEHNQEYYKAGSVFFELEHDVHENIVPPHWFRGVLSFWGQPTPEQKKILRAQLKASPCYKQSNWEWLAGIKLGLYYDD